MTAQDIWDFLEKGGMLGFCIFSLWALIEGKIIRRGEYDNLQRAYEKLERTNDAANAELQKQSATNARLVEMSFQQSREAENIRRNPTRKSEARDDPAR